MTEEHDERRYKVVYNDEEQYSIWFADQEVPAGWHEEGTAGTKDQCLAHIDEVWTDLRPRSVREHLATAASGAPEEQA